MILAGIAYEQIGERQDRKRFPQIGRSVDIGRAFAQHLLFGRRWSHRDSGHGRVCTRLWEFAFSEAGCAIHARLLFDRAGLDGSDPSPIEQTSTAVAEDLHALLHAAGVPSPYVLVGSSFSGFNVRVFAGKYPSEVAGAVLVDSAHEDQYRYEPRVTLGPFNRLPKPIRNLFCACVPMRRAWV